MMSCNRAFLCNFIAFLCLCLLFSLSNCARLGSPVGGDKDSIPPQFMFAKPDTFAVNVTKNLKSIRLDFNEYIELKDIQKNLVISPSLNIKKVIPTQFPSKYIYIEWSDSLKANTTYNFNFGNAIVDYNEGNSLAYFQYVFGTGKRLDSLGVSGTARAFEAGKNKASHVLVALYKANDSMNYKKKANYTTRTDADDYFELSYIANGTYQLIAFDDENSNGIHDAPKENMAFLDDKIELNQITRSLTLDLYPCFVSEKFKEVKVIPGGLLFSFEGQPEHLKLLPVESPFKEYKVSHKSLSDSAFVFFPITNDYEKQGKSMKWAYEMGGKSDTVSVFFRSTPKLELSLSNPIGETLDPKTDFQISANFPIHQIDASAWKLTEDGVKIPFSQQISEQSPNTVAVKAAFVSNKKYQLEVPKQSLSSYYLKNEKDILFEFKIAKNEDYGQFELKIQHPPICPFWVVLTSESGRKITRYVTNVSKIRYDFLKPETYELVILEDKNGNKKWDGVQFDKRIQSEKRWVFPKKISIRPLWEINESWDLNSNTTSNHKIPNE